MTGPALAQRPLSLGCPLDALSPLHSSFPGPHRLRVVFLDDLVLWVCCSSSSAARTRHPAHHHSRPVWHHGDDLYMPWRKRVYTCCLWWRCCRMLVSHLNISIRCSFSVLDPGVTMHASHIVTAAAMLHRLAFTPNQPPSTLFLCLPVELVRSRYQDLSFMRTVPRSHLFVSMDRQLVSPSAPGPLPLLCSPSRLPLVLVPRQS